MTINTEKVTTYEFSFTNQDIEALKRVYELFEYIDSELTKEGNPDHIIDSENKTRIDVSIFSKTCETIKDLLDFEGQET